ncbi:MAG: hypothetical protein OJF49_003950 [Ktedonobacterales bacterium]|jgi:alpha-beta hydrolase superfamily lysophospholipase|nr:MAG: hypothetical protein OJF49_003950 [Ktedonobacterales bacterium]
MEERSPITIPAHAAKIPRWLPVAATGLGVTGLAVSSGSLALAVRFVRELSRPHQELDESRMPPDVLMPWTMPITSPEPPAALQRSLLFQTKRGVELRGDFWAQPRPAPTIVLCHGYRASRARLRPAAALEYEHGFNVLLFDFRGHGESAHAETTGGIAEVYDLEAAIALAAEQPETLPNQIIVHGFSMGAATALLLPQQPGVVAIIADSPYARLDDILRRMIGWQLGEGTAAWRSPLRPLRRVIPAISWATVTASDVVFRVRFGLPLYARPASSFQLKRGWRSKRSVSSSHVPVLLIHATRDPFIPIAHARQIADAATRACAPLETYFAESAIHCGAFASDPQRYITAVLDFIRRSLAGEAGRSPSTAWR